MNRRVAPPLRESDLDPDPLVEFAAWLAEADAAGLPAPEAMTLATATPDGTPSARMILLKSFDERGFTFHTNYESRKARELAANARAALVFYWEPLGRQIRVEGTAERVAEQESAAYFRTRPRAARLSAWASRQSEAIESRVALEAQVDEVRRRFGDDPPLPPFWGGFRVVPRAIEFWQHREDRLHDRFRYERSEGGWAIERLSP